MSSNRNVLTWSLNAGTTAYERDLEQYGNKIYAIGVHEFQVDGDGLVYVRRTMANTTTPVPNTGQRADTWAKDWAFWPAIEKGMKRWPHIGWYYSFILFGADRVTQMLDTPASQDTLIQQIGAVLDHHTVTDDQGRNLIKGVEIDFEATYSDDSLDSRTGDDDKFLAILRRVKEEVCIPRGLVLQVNGYAMWGNQVPFYYRFHNYAKWAEATDSRGSSVIDELQIMTYDFAWNGSAPGPSTPLWWFENVANWAYSNFGRTPREDDENPVDKASGATDYTYNSAAALTIDRVFFGSAAYGHRWPMFDQSNQYGSTITYRNLIGWQNGKYRHSHTEGGVRYWHDQEFLQQAGIEDQESKNELLYQHVYDMSRVRYAEITPVEATGAASGVLAEYNSKEYITTYSRLQQAEFVGVHDVAISATVAGYAHETPTTTVTRTIDGTENVFHEYRIDPVLYVAAEDETCSLDTKKPAGKITFSVDVPAAGTYEIVILVDFPMFGQTVVVGNVNGTAFSIGENVPDYYPLFFKGAHFVKVGDFNLNAGTNTIEVTGEPNSPNPKTNTPFYGFIVCDQFVNTIEGGRMEFDVNVQPFKKKDGTDAAIPSELVVVGQALRQDARPVIMYEDRFAQYIGQPAASDLTAAGYYLFYGEHSKGYGRGTTWSNPIYDDKPDPANPGSTIPVFRTATCSGTYTGGLSRGTWTVDRDTYAAYATTNSVGGSPAQLVFNYKFKEGNSQIDAEFAIQDGDSFGILFGMTDQDNGFALIASYSTQKVALYEMVGGALGAPLFEEPLSEALVRGKVTKMRVRNSGGYARCYLGYGNKRVLTDYYVGYTGGAAGVYSSGSEVRVYVFSAATTDRWEVMEKFEIEVNGQTQRFGEIARSAYTFDEYGFLNYSGIDELSTRDATDPDAAGISLDYQYWMHNVAGWQGPAKVKVRLIDAGIWFSELLVGDAQGCSITWCGDAQSFLNSMNLAVEKYGAKGIGLWTMGQEDPRVFEVIPDVVPYHG